VGQARRRLRALAAAEAQGLEAVSAHAQQGFADPLASIAPIALSKYLLITLSARIHPNYWEQPEHFYPDHFNREKENSRPAFVYVPFGGGPRLCLGHNFAMLVMHIVVCRIVQSFQFTVPENYVPVVEPNITLRAKKGIQLIIKKLSAGSDIRIKNTEKNKYEESNTSSI